MIKTSEQLPEESRADWILGKGPKISGHQDGEYSLMFYDGLWWNEDGTEICDTPPESWVYLKDLPKLTRYDAPPVSARWILAKGAHFSNHVRGTHGLALYTEEGWAGSDGLELTRPPEAWEYLEDLLK